MRVMSDCGAQPNQRDATSAPHAIDATISRSQGCCRIRKLQRCRRMHDASADERAVTGRLCAIDEAPCVRNPSKLLVPVSATVLT